MQMFGSSSERGRRLCSLILYIAVAAGAAAGTAQAAPPPTAAASPSLPSLDEQFQQHCTRAISLCESKDYEASARAFQATYALKQLPRLILNLGQVYRKMGRAKEALGY